VISPVTLTLAVGSLPFAVGALRRIEGVAETPYWALTVPGVDALGAWRHFREQVDATGFWPVIIGEFGGPEFGGSDAALEGLIEEALANRELSEDQLRFRGTGRSPDEILELARTCALEEWARRQRDPKFRESEQLRKASYFDKLGAAAARLAQLHRDRQSAGHRLRPGHSTRRTMSFRQRRITVRRSTSYIA